MNLRLTNTLSGQKEDFIPLRPGKAGMYNCGPTVYHFAHIGNMRSYIMADILRRTLEWNDYEVRQIINITDVGHLVGDGDTGEDKLVKAAQTEGRKVTEIADYYTGAFWHDLSLLNIKTTGTLFPKATDHIPEQIALIEELEKKGFTYRTEDGIYFDTTKFPAYGKLGNIDLAGIRAGARVEQGGKKSPTDFALWKFFQGEGRREQEWESPWGKGFPGWHIECSAMSMKYLGATFDLHTGGIDHIPVHHNNEIAQSESATGEQYARYWLHNEFVNVGGAKMAKSVGNVQRLADLIAAGIHPLSYRYFVLGAHYRTPLNFTDESIQGAQNAFETLVKMVARILLTTRRLGEPQPFYLSKFTDFLNDDLDTPKALALVHELMKDSLEDSDKLATLLEFDKVLGLDLKRIGGQMADIPKEIVELNMAREQARVGKNWKEADRLRQELADRGYLVSDYAKGSLIERKLKSLIIK